MTTQNPFKTNSNSSRFSKENFFTDEESKTSFSRVKEKKEKESRQSSESRDKIINTFIQDNKKNDNYKRAPKNNQRFKNYVSDIKNDNHNDNNKKDFAIDIEDFPVLGNADIKETNVTTEKTFTDVLNTIKISEDDNQDKIKPGWVVISKNKETNANEFLYGEMTPYQIKVQEYENDISHMMSCIEFELNRIWNKNKDIYDSINGEGSYEEKFYLPPVYDDFEDYYDENELDENDVDYYNSDFDRDMSDIDYNSDYY